uniref:Uncharacterized protein n=1 Tax=Solanum tuberosum TaxID=4113 RepID=M1AGH2_SOLTU
MGQDKRGGKWRCPLHHPDLGGKSGNFCHGRRQRRAGGNSSDFNWRLTRVYVPHTKWTKLSVGRRWQQPEVCGTVLVTCGESKFLSRFLALSDKWQGKLT